MVGWWRFEDHSFSTRTLKPRAANLSLFPRYLMSMYYVPGFAVTCTVIFT